jgi:hypothetical protein
MVHQIRRSHLATAVAKRLGGKMKGPMIAAITAALYIVSFAPAVQAEEGICRGFAGGSGTLKYSGAKCALKSRPGNYVIRRTVWENKDADAYKAFLRVANRTFTCEMTIAGGGGKDGIDIVKYKLSNCH